MMISEQFAVDDHATPEYLAGIAGGLRLAAQLVVSLGSLLNDPCGECDGCRHASDHDRETLTAIFQANRVFSAEVANACDDMSTDAMTIARMAGYRPPRPGPGDRNGRNARRG